MKKNENAVSQIFGILLMTAIVVVIGSVIAIYSFDLSNEKLSNSGYDIDVVIDTVNKIQYDQNDISIFLANHSKDSEIYRISKNEKNLITKLEDSYMNQTSVEIYYTHIGWLYQINNVEYTGR